MDSPASHRTSAEGVRVVSKPLLSPSFCCVRGSWTSLTTWRSWFVWGRKSIQRKTLKAVLIASTYYISLECLACSDACTCRERPFARRRTGTFHTYSSTMYLTLAHLKLKYSNSSNVRHCELVLELITVTPWLEIVHSFYQRRSGGFQRNHFCLWADWNRKGRGNLHHYLRFLN